MDYFQILLASFTAGFLYIAAPGAGFISILSIVSMSGRKDGAQFASGMLLGDLMWLVLTYLFLVGANYVPDVFLSALNFLCGGYLLYIAFRMISGLKSLETVPLFANPFRSGVTLGVLNPKSYPVSISLFTALLVDYRELLIWEKLPALMLSAVLGMICAYGIEVYFSGFMVFRRYFSHHWRRFYIFFAGIFALFAAVLLVEFIETLTKSAFS